MVTTLDVMQIIKQIFNIKKTILELKILILLSPGSEIITLIKLPKTWKVTRNIYISTQFFLTKYIYCWFCVL